MFGRCLLALVVIFANSRSIQAQFPDPTWFNDLGFVPDQDDTEGCSIPWYNESMIDQPEGVAGGTLLLKNVCIKQASVK